MAKSGIPWTDATFDWCVQLLVYCAKVLGLSYEEINVYLFVIALPIVLGVSLALNVGLTLAIRRTKATG